MTVQYIWDFGIRINPLDSTYRCGRNASFTWTTSNIAPGDYALQLLVADDLTDPLADGIADVLETVLSSMLLFKFRPTFESITCLQPSLLGSFTLEGQILDDDDNSRALISGVRLDVYWQSNPEERLRSGVPTLSMVVSTFQFQQTPRTTERFVDHEHWL